MTLSGGIRSVLRRDALNTRLTLLRTRTTVEYMTQLTGDKVSTVKKREIQETKVYDKTEGKTAVKEHIYIHTHTICICISIYITIYVYSNYIYIYYNTNTHTHTHILHTHTHTICVCVCVCVVIYIGY